MTTEVMRRVEADADWSLFDPDELPELPDLWGEAFDAAYRAPSRPGGRCLGSINLAAHLAAGHKGMDWERLRATVRTAVTFLDRVIDINYYPTE